jgi:hypothetical protein
VPPVGVGLEPLLPLDAPDPLLDPDELEPVELAPLDVPVAPLELEPSTTSMLIELAGSATWIAPPLMESDGWAAMFAVDWLLYQRAVAPAGVKLPSCKVTLVT